MKKLLFIILLAPVMAFAQGEPLNEDTMKVRNFTLRAQDWVYAVAFVNVSVGDTITLDFLDHLKTKIRAVQNPTWNTNITVDSMPLKLVKGLYNVYYSSQSSNITLLGTNIGDKLQAVTYAPFVEWRQTRNAELTNQFNALREVGRRFLTGK